MDSWLWSQKGGATPIRPLQFADNSELTFSKTVTQRLSVPEFLVILSINAWLLSTAFRVALIAASDLKFAKLLESLCVRAVDSYV
jgi:hypothetical protein